MVKDMLARHGNKVVGVVEESDNSELETDEETCDPVEERSAKELLAKTLIEDTNSVIEDIYHVN